MGEQGGWDGSHGRPPSKLSRPCSRQAPSTLLSSGGSSHPKSCDQLRCGPYLSSGDVADALGVHSAGSSSSDVEQSSVSSVPESPDGQEEKVSASPLLPDCPAPGPGGFHPTPIRGPGAPHPGAGHWPGRPADRAVPTVQGLGLRVVTGDLRQQLGLQQRLVLLSLHDACGCHAYPQTLRLRGLWPQLLTAPLQPAGGRLLHHPRQPGRGQRQYVQEHPGESRGWASLVPALRQATHACWTPSRARCPGAHLPGDQERQRVSREQKEASVEIQDSGGLHRHGTRGGGTREGGVKARGQGPGSPRPPANRRRCWWGRGAGGSDSGLLCGGGLVAGEAERPVRRQPGRENSGYQAVGCEGGPQGQTLDVI